MGFFNRYRKEERLHITRDENGNIIGTERENKNSAEHKFQEYEARQLAREHERARKKEFHIQTKREAKEAYEKEYRLARIERSARLGRKQGSHTSMDRLEHFIMSSPRPRRMPHYSFQQPRIKKKKKHTTLTIPDFHLDPFDNWGMFK